MDGYPVSGPKGKAARISYAKSLNEVVGKLLWLTRMTRPDIAMAVSFVSQQVAEPSKGAWGVVSRIFRYLAGTKSYGVKYWPKESERKSGPYCHVDADWAGDVTTRRSQYGYVVYMFGGPLSWASKKQRSVALSSAEAELMGLTECIKECLRLRLLLNEIGLASYVTMATPIFEDNQACIAMANDGMAGSRLKHVDIRYRFSVDHVKAGSVVLHKIASEDNSADMLTKPLGKIKFQKHRKAMVTFGEK